MRLHRSARLLLSTFGRRTLALRSSGATAASEITTSSSMRDRKRFYDTVGVEKVVIGDGVERWEVKVDGRTVRTPRGVKLRVPSEVLARTIAGEWARQSEFLQPEDMPIMTLSSTALHMTPLDHADIVSSLLPFLDTDTTCCRVDASDQPKLHRIQAKLWDPLLVWFDEKYGVKLRVSSDIVMPEQDPDAKAKLEVALRQLDPWRTSALQSLALACKSVVIALALVEHAITPRKAFDAARTEESYQIELWGEVINGHDLDINYLLLNTYAASTFVWTLPPANELTGVREKGATTPRAAAAASEEALFAE